ncbi:MAG: hypothetical protein HY259_13075 [Chloroflexi bacterium]|nr:hypothetical protein [Chloroflexota bacterium]MBI3734369.1 hypothetical protein [Chloroflexota bacterium]
MRRQRVWMWLIIGLALASVAAAPASVPAQWVRFNTSNAPTATAAHMLAYDSKRGVVVKFGGSDSNGDLINETWELDPRTRTWTKRTPVHAPPARTSTAMVYDVARHVTVLFGGYNFKYLDDTWLWDGTDWTQVFPAHSPAARTGEGAAYDSRRQQVVVFGGVGYYPPGFFDDLWRWDGTDWSERAASIRPPARASMAFAYDSHRDALVVFSGGSPTGSIYTDTWEWINNAWTQRQPVTVPVARVYAASGYSPTGGYTMFFGGEDAELVFRSDTWLWEGTNWMQSTGPRHPSGRTNEYGAVYVSGLRGILMHGGYDFTRLTDTWLFADPR